MIKIEEEIARSSDDNNADGLTPISGKEGQFVEFVDLYREVAQQIIDVVVDGVNTPIIAAIGVGGMGKSTVFIPLMQELFRNHNIEPVKFDGRVVRQCYTDGVLDLGKFEEILMGDEKFGSSTVLIIDEPAATQDFEVEQFLQAFKNWHLKGVILVSRGEDLDESKEGVSGYSPEHSFHLPTKIDTELAKKYLRTLSLPEAVIEELTTYFPQWLTFRVLASKIGYWAKTTDLLDIPSLYRYLDNQVFEKPLRKAIRSRIIERDTLLSPTIP